MKKITVSIVGASGYAGGELLRILLAHPFVEMKQVTARKFVNAPVSLTHPNLRGFTDLKYEKLEKLESCDLLFVSLPNGISQEKMSNFQKIAGKIIDLGADFRLESLEDYKTWYRWDHKSPGLVGKFTYGIAEINRKNIKNATLVAQGGCEATASILTLYPLFKEGVIDLEKPLIIDAKMGSSAAGVKPSLGSHHPERSGCVRSFQPTGHRHTAEVNEWMKKAGEISDVDLLPINISATAIDMVRGILVTAHVFTKEKLHDLDLLKIYRKYYKSEKFIRVLFERMGVYRMPEPKILAGTNFFDVGFQSSKFSNRVVIVGALDNLTKGTAGQAVQSMNLMFGFPEEAGLMFSGLHPA